MSCAPLGSRDLGWSPSVHAGMGGRPHTPALPPGQRGGSVQRRESPSCPARGLGAAPRGLGPAPRRGRARSHGHPTAARL